MVTGQSNACQSWPCLALQGLLGGQHLDLILANAASSPVRGVVPPIQAEDRPPPGRSERWLALLAFGSSSDKAKSSGLA
jgi:hypothetical protein